jgi:hypothetical protein
MQSNLPSRESVLSGLLGDGSITSLLIMAGKFVASFGGVACVAVIVFSSYKLIFGLVSTDTEREVVRYKTSLRNAIAGLIILSLALMITQTIIPQQVPVLQPHISGGGFPESYGLAIFWAFFAILPISKMMSNIFMSLLARIGTVDEQALAVGGSGALMALARWRLPLPRGQKMRFSIVIKAFKIISSPGKT